MATTSSSPPTLPLQSQPHTSPHRAPNIAIIGATGNLARHLINTLLSLPDPSPHRATTSSPAPLISNPAFGLLVLFTRADPAASPLLRRWCRNDRVKVVRWRECLRDGHGYGHTERGAVGHEEGEGCDCAASEEAEEVISPECLARGLRRWEVGVVVNCLSPLAGAVREVVVRGVMLANGGRVEGGKRDGKGREWDRVRLYFPPEFGLDDCVGGRVDVEPKNADDENGRVGRLLEKRKAMMVSGVQADDDNERPYARYFEVPEWQLKQSHYAVASALLEPVGVKIVRLHVGLFLNAVGPWFGFHTARGVYSVVGDPRVRMAWTDLGDVAKAILVLMGRVFNGEDVPGRLRVAGCVVSPEEIKEAMEQAGAGEITVRSGTEVGVFRERALSRKSEERSPIPFIRLMMAEGLGDYRNAQEGGWGNDNEYVNPGQKIWKWRGVEELAEQTGGRPNAGA